MNKVQNKRIYQKKICMLGTFGVGKTSLVRRFVHGLFDDAYLSTIGVQVFHKELQSKPDEDGLKMVIWDLANVERFTAVEKQYFRGASGAIIVVDLSRPNTLLEKDIHINAFMGVNPSARLVFAGNKMDLIGDDEKTLSALQEIADNHQAPYLLTSAKVNNNVDTLFNSIGELLLEKA